MLVFDFERVNGKELRDPVRHDLLELLSGPRLERAQELRAHKASRRKDIPSLLMQE